MAINVLNNLIINRISAGEVAESPFSVVKELIDNSIDAGATKLTVEIKNGGTTLISVRDNGCGIAKDDIVKAFLPHATSKISNVEDLDNIVTLGFRGEALASISNVSHTLLTTKTKNSDCAYSLEVDAGKFSAIVPTVCDDGTLIEVRDLFYNTPARRKFMKKPKQEESQITNIVARYILAHPDIAIKYIVDDSIIYSNKGGSLQDAIYCVYGKDTLQNVMPIKKQIGNLILTGYVSKIGFSKPNTTYQTLIINSRYVVDEIVSKAAYMAFEEYLMTRQFPFYVLHLSMPAIDVDVNVHPSKMTVKFASPSQIYDLVYSAIRSAIFKSLDTNPSQTLGTKPVEEQIIKTDINSLKEIQIEPVKTVQPLDRVVELKQSTFTPITIFDLTQPKQTIIQQDSQLKNNSYVDAEKTEKNNSIDMPLETKDYIDVSNLPNYKLLGELFNEFLLLEYKDNLMLMDFHAAHERLNYDKLTNMVSNREVIQQDLLIPYVQELTPVEVTYIMSLKDNLTEVGFDVDEFGNKIKINSIPVLLKDINLKTFVDDLLHDMKNIKPKINSELTHYLMQKACKSSVKSGMKLSDLEITSLLGQLNEKNPVLLCPHGRPVVYVVTRNQIEKWFKRIV